jgi:predicted MPP superfamily phosphohydrolase
MMEPTWRILQPASVRPVLLPLAAAALLSSLVLMFALTVSNSKPSPSTGPASLLSFTPTSSPDAFTFTIVQIADIHLGEAEDLDWGPEQDRKTYRALERILSYQRADFIILSGDQLTGNNVDENATAYYKILGDFIDSYQTPWGIIFGNHDDSDLEHENGTVSQAKTSRRELVQSIQHYEYGMTRGLDTPDDVFGVSNYVLNVPLQGKIGVQLLLLDSGGGSLPSNIQQSQLDWISTIRVKDTPAVAFQHIPTQQHTYNEDKCVGSNGDGGITPLDADAGIVNYLNNDGNVHILAVGHNHGNSYCCPIQTLSVCFGRHSGYGGYGKFDRGARVYELTVHVKNGAFSYKSWVQMESGEVVEEYVPEHAKDAVHRSF